MRVGDGIMVEFIDTFETEPVGPCKRILKQEEQYIRDMIEDTLSDGKERVGAIMFHEGSSYTTEPRKGTEEAISAEAAARTRMDAGAKMTRDVLGGTARPGEYEAHLVHTHPNGHPEPSMRDLKSIVEGLKEGKGRENTPNSNLIATQLDEGVFVGGLYRSRELEWGESEQAKEHLRVLDINSDVAPMSVTKKKSELVDILTEVGYRGCHVLFPKDNNRR